MEVQTQITFGRLAPLHKMPGACTLYVTLASLRLDVSDVEPAYRFHYPRPQISERHICKYKTVAGHLQIPLHANPDIALQTNAIRPTDMQRGRELHRHLWDERIDERPTQVAPKLERDLRLPRQRRGGIMKWRRHPGRADVTAIKGQMRQGQRQCRRTLKYRLRDTELTLVEFCRIQPQFWKLHNALDTISLAVTRQTTAELRDNKAL